MTTRLIRNEEDKAILMRFLRQKKPPYSVEVTTGRKRTVEQNRLQRLWMKEISEQLADQTPEEVRAYCKLTMGVPILRRENEAFREKYDAVVRPLPYEQKLAIMQEPLDMPVTRLMTTVQKAAYLDAIQKHFGALGVVLTDPDPFVGRAA